jgi:hypothetical protein
VAANFRNIISIPTILEWSKPSSKNSFHFLELDEIIVMLCEINKNVQE